MRSISLPKRLIASYVFDWICIVGIAGAGGALNVVSPYHRPFSPSDLSISYPYISESISIVTVAAVSLAGPLVVAIAVPGPNLSSNRLKKTTIQKKAWEWFVAWTGLALSLASAFFVTQGLKNLFGKPRPDLLQRCQPDIANISAYTVNHYIPSSNPDWTLVNSSICKQPDKAILDDGFRSFPSGHSSIIWAGMLYLSLFLCSKFAVAIPGLFRNPMSGVSEGLAGNTTELLPMHGHDLPPTGRSGESSRAFLPVQGQPAASSDCEKSQIRKETTYYQAAAPPRSMASLLRSHRLEQHSTSPRHDIASSITTASISSLARQLVLFRLMFNLDGITLRLEEARVGHLVLAAKTAPGVSALEAMITLPLVLLVK